MNKHDLRQKAMILINEIEDVLAANSDITTDVTGQEVTNHLFTKRMIDIAFRQGDTDRLEVICGSLKFELSELKEGEDDE